MGYVAAAYAVGKIVTAGHGGMLASAFGNSPTPKPSTPPPMPDQTTMDQAAQLQAARQAALQEGRQATMLSSNQSTGDKLGP